MADTTGELGVTGRDGSTTVTVRSRRRTAAWVATAVAVPLILLVFALAKGSITRQAAATRAPITGKPAPAIEATDLDGRFVSIEAWRGRWVLVNMFATWCVPCRDEHDDLMRFTDAHRLLGDVAMVQVIYKDTTAAVSDFRVEHGGSWPIITDPDKRIAARYGVTGVPETFLINPDGFVAAKLVGGVTDEQLESVLDAGRS